MNREKCYVVYALMNKSTRQYFIGRTCQALDKLWENQGEVYRSNIKLYTDIQKYGWDNFEQNVLAQNLSNYESKVICNQYIDQFESIYNGYNMRLNDLANKNEIGPGRPRKDRRNKIKIGFESTRPLKIRLEEEAKRRNKSLSAFIREILERYFEER